MLVNTFLDILGADFYTGVPDSALKPLCDTLIQRFGTDGRHHLIAANEGCCAAAAAGYHLATGRTAVIYMQNSGEGNFVNPAVSLLHEKVYGIPVQLVIGWRGEPGTADEPQHAYQGEITCRLLALLEIPFQIIGPDTPAEAVCATAERFRALHAQGRQTAYVIRRGALQSDCTAVYQNENPLLREEIIRRVLRVSGEDAVIATTGKAGRELFELRESDGTGHARDFLTVGSMGHCSSVALGAALQCPQRRFWCIDGDGAVLMHMGAMAVIGAQSPANLVHIVIDNGAHESVGGMPTAMQSVDLPAAARACGYGLVLAADSAASLDSALAEAKKSRCLTFLAVKAAIGARSSLGRPSSPPQENKRAFMAYLSAPNGDNLHI